ncbi:TetR/AcrR family transcriptional regulator [Streptacidiphilus sp. PAMC 29251]
MRKLTHEIKEEARRQLAVEGPQKLSLRAVARELGMVSSALYRYFPSRDDLLTALIIDAYNALGDQVEQAVSSTVPRSDTRARWFAACVTVRAWARAHPHEYALLYGTPVPGYSAPEQTVAPAARVPLVLVGLLQDTVGRFAIPAPVRPLRGPLAEQLADLASRAVPGLPPALLARGLSAWTQLFGLVSFELFGHFVGSADPADAFFRPHHRGDRRLPRPPGNPLTPPSPDPRRLSPSRLSSPAPSEPARTRPNPPRRARPRLSPPRCRPARTPAPRAPAPAPSALVPPPPPARPEPGSGPAAAPSPCRPAGPPPP